MYRLLLIMQDLMIYKSGRIALLLAMDKDGLFVETVFSSLKRLLGEYVYSEARLKNKYKRLC
jgi:hypothetical protein